MNVMLTELASRYRHYTRCSAIDQSYFEVIQNKIQIGLRRRDLGGNKLETQSLTCARPET